MTTRAEKARSVLNSKKDFDEVVDTIKRGVDRCDLKVSGPGKVLGIPALLEERRLEYQIHDEAFKYQAVFDRVLVYMIPEEWFKGETWGQSSIVMAQVTKDKESFQTPRGIIVSMGPIAMNELRSNGIDLGHIVKIVRHAPYRMPYGLAPGSGKEETLTVVRAMDMLCSEDLRSDLVKGRVRYELNDKNDHLFVDRRGRTWSPMDTATPGDY